MNKLSLLLLSLMTIGSGYAQEHTAPQEEKQKITEFIFNALRNSKSKNWCKYSSHGRSCSPCFKKLLLDEDGILEAGRYIVDMKKSNPDNTNDAFTVIQIRENEEDKNNNYFGVITTNITVKGPKKIERFEQQFSKDKEYDYIFFRDENTTCKKNKYHDEDGIFTAYYVCSTSMNHQKFGERMTQQ